MIKKILTGCVVALFISNCFAGYSSGGRSGYSGGSRSYSSSSYSSGRSGYSRSITRAYVAPRTYTRSYSQPNRTTVIHHNYSSGGFGGGGFFSGLLGGYLGGSLANSYHPTMVAGTGVVQGQGMLMEGAAPYTVSTGYSAMSCFITFLLLLVVIGFLVWIFSLFIDYPRDCHHRNRW